MILVIVEITRDLLTTHKTVDREHIDDQKHQHFTNNIPPRRQARSSWPRSQPSSSRSAASLPSPHRLQPLHHGRAQRPRVRFLVDQDGLGGREDLFLVEDAVRRFSLDEILPLLALCCIVIMRIEGGGEDDGVEGMSRLRTTL
ncbi:hypothetical protein Droror1_Dr00005389 [Drosera rotundifolia]